MAVTIRVYPNEDPRIVEILPEDLVASSQDATIQDIYDAIRDWEDEPASMAYTSLISGAGKEQLGGGVTVGITATLQNSKVMFTGRTTPLEQNGTCTTTNTKGIRLYATGGQFVTNGIYPGCTVINTTTKSRAAVIEVISETELRCFRLTGGSNNSWTSGDGYDVHPNVQCNISGGNLVAVDINGDEMSPVLQSPNVQIVRTSSSSATLQELGAIQYSSFNGGVTFDVLNGEAGTEFPIGTVESPVDNLADAMSIANTRGFNVIYVKGDATIDAGGSYVDMTFIGESPTKTTMTISAAANVLGCEFYDAEVLGTLDGNCVLNGCVLSDLNYVYGTIQSCILQPGTIVLAGNNPAHFLDCWAGSPSGAMPVIDFGGSGQSLALQNYNGRIKLINKNGSDSAEINLNAGQVVLDSTITDGSFVISGVGTLTDNSSGTTVDTAGLMSRETITAVTWDTIYIDTAGGQAGTGFPIGTQSAPVNNITDARTIADERGIHQFFLSGNIILTGDWSDREFASHSYEDAQIDCQGTVDLSHAGFTNIEITETGATVTGDFHCDKCKFSSGFNGISAIMSKCNFSGMFVIQSGGTLTGDECLSENAIVNLNGDGDFSQSNYTGVATLLNATDPGVKIGVSGNYLLTLMNTCVAGQAFVVGTGQFVDNSGPGMVVIEKTLPGSAWDELQIDHTVSGSFGEALSFVKEIEGGRWKINTATNQMIFYKEDNSTELARFNLKDSVGSPASTDVFERERV